MATGTISLNAPKHADAATGFNPRSRKSGYLSRLKTRRDESSLKENILFGLGVGWALTLVGGFRYLFLVEGDAWLYTSYAGMAVLATTLVVPDLISFPRKLLHTVGSAVANQIFKFILAAIYFAIIMPVGLLRQKMKGREPFYAWDETVPAKIEGWVEKISSDQKEMVKAGRGKASMLVQPMHVIGYFVANGQAFLLPCLLLFLLLGVVGIFLQSSALAPFIYTLF